jgi:TetR/AcrR family transcriptional regulator
LTFNRDAYGRRRSNRREQIIQAALRVFAQYGFHKATLKRIAAEAKLKSPALIYWYFKDKDELVKAVMLTLSPLLRQISQPEGLMDRPPDEVLTLFGRGFLGMYANPAAAGGMRLLFSEALRAPEEIAVLVESGPLLALKFIVAYLQHQIDLGRLRPHDPQVSARAFTGTLLVNIFARMAFPQLAEGLPDPDHYVQEAVEMLLRGLRP